MKLAAIVIYVDDLRRVLDFYRRAFALEPSFVDLDMQVTGRHAGGRYQFASIGRVVSDAWFSSDDGFVVARSHFTPSSMELARREVGHLVAEDFLENSSGARSR